LPVRVAGAPAAVVLQPFSLQAQRLPVLRARGPPHRLLSVERRHLDVASEGDGGEVDRDLAEQIDAVAAEDLVFLHVHDDVEMAGGPAARAGFALTLEPQLLAGGDPRRNLDRNLPFPRHLAGAAAGGAWLRDDLSSAAALRARARHREESLLQ